jgi:hypothetical protein
MPPKDRSSPPPSLSHTLDLFGDPIEQQPPLPSTVRRVINAAVEIAQDPPENIDFLHAVLCQVGMPRKKTEGRIFERQNGTTSMVLEAGRIWRQGKWVEQPLPYGTKPRLVMVHISGEAVRRKSREIEIGSNMREFLIRLGIDTSGGSKGGYTMFKKQMEALAACRLSLGASLNDRDITINTQPIRRFEAWLNHDSHQQTIWPGVLELSEDFYSTLTEHAVPLDHRALAAIKHSALALDIYTWFAHRLCRIGKPEGIHISWANLKSQFGQEYGNPKDFKREFRQALIQVRSVYPDARLDSFPGGLVLLPSKPPVPKTQVLMPKRAGDKS